MFHPIASPIELWRHKSKLLSISVYLLFMVIITSSSIQSELAALKTDPFYIDLQHKLSSSDTFKPRGSLLVKPKTDYRPAQATFTQPQTSLSESELKILKEASDKGDTYYLRASIRKKKPDAIDKAGKVTQTIIKSCSLVVANLADTLVINLNPLNEFLGLNIFTTDQECIGQVPRDISGRFNTTIQLVSGSLGPQPDTATYIKRLEEERQSKQKEGKEDNRSFLAKYWIYIVPAVIILMMMGGPEQGAR